MTITEPRDFRTLEFAKPASDFSHHAAFVIDDIVEDILHFDNDIATLFQGTFSTKQVDSAENGGPLVNWLYDPATETFSEDPENPSAVVYKEFESEFKIAIIVNNVVKFIFNTSERLASILLSSPQIIWFDLEGNLNLAIKDLYNSSTNSFSKPDVEEPVVES